MPGTQLPPWHVSAWVHAVPSLQAPLLARCVQPAVKSHASSVQMLPSLQLALAPARHALLTQTSPTVQALPSLHVAELALEVHPTLATQVSSVHGLASSHSARVPPTHAPCWHASTVVHGSLSLQAPALGVLLHLLAAQASAVHGLPSSHEVAPLPAHAPFWHESLLVQ